MSVKNVEGREIREAAIVVRCTQTYRDWVGRLAESERTIPSQIVDRALVALSREMGIDKPPPR